MAGTQTYELRGVGVPIQRGQPVLSALSPCSPSTAVSYRRAHPFPRARPGRDGDDLHELHYSRATGWSKTGSWEEQREGKECVRRCRSGGTPDTYKQKKT